MDLLTITAAMSVANSAFNAIKQGFAAAKDIESMASDVGRWMGAVSDIDNAENKPKILPYLVNCLRPVLSKRQLSQPTQQRRSWKSSATSSKSFLT